MNHSPAAPFSPAERRQLLALARDAIAAATSGTLPNADAALPPRLQECHGCFVTLTHAGELRGCIGCLTTREPLHQALRQHACAAALHDSRFRPVEADELDQLTIEISVLTQPQPLNFTTPAELLAQLRPGVDGVVLRVGSRSATFLPQVWEHFPEPEVFLNQLAAKAGGAPAAWREPGAAVLTYQVEAFRDSEVAE